MEWIEIITLRTGGGNAEAAADAVRHAFVAESENGPVRVRLFRSATVETDVSVHITYRERSAAPTASALGDRLVAFLEAYGWVSRSVWRKIETERGEEDDV